MAKCKKAFDLKARFNIVHQDEDVKRKNSYIKHAIKDVLTEAVFPADVESNTVNYFTRKNPDGSYENGFNWKHPATARYQARDAAKQILRYTNSEDRKPLYLDGKEIKVGKVKEEYWPDEVFIRTNSDGVRFIEVVKILTTAPKLRQGEANSGTEKWQAYLLYKSLCYGRTLLEKKGAEHVKASLYFLRKKTDVFEQNGDPLTASFDKDFFNRQKGYVASAYAENIISLEEDYNRGLRITKVFTTNPRNKTGKVVELPNWDEIYANCIKANQGHKSADECTENDCKFCEMRASCKYENPPMKMEVEKVAKKGKRMLLNADQQAAANFDSGFCRINAGAGTGKTETVRAHFMALCDKGYSPYRILLTTFTNAGAEEMKNRIKNSRGGLRFKGHEVDVNDLSITTFNSFGDMLIKHHYKDLGFTAEPKVIDDVERKRIIADILKNVPEIPGLDYRNFTMDERYVKGALATAVAVFELVKRYELTSTDVSKCSGLLQEKYGFRANEAAVAGLLNVFEKYDTKLRDNNLIEYADQIAMISELAYQDIDFFEKLGYEHIIVDEFQDTDEQQIQLLQRLADTTCFKSLMVVGDDSQAIYSFRDTTPHFIIHFEDYIEGDLDDIYLLENYRCTPEIIDFANRINEMNVNRVAKNLVAHNPSGEPVTVVGFPDSVEEYNYIVEQVEQNIQEGVAPEDICLIAAKKTELQRMAALLAEKGIPSVMMNPEPLLENPRVLSAIGMLHALQNRDDNLGIFLYASALMGGKLDEEPATTQRKWFDYASDKLGSIRGLPDVVKKQKIMEFLQELDRGEDEVYENFLNTLEFKRTCNEIFRYVNDFEEYGKKVEVRRNHSYPGVVLTTAHSSKGMEWPYVYVSVSGFDKEETHDSLKMVEETRRLLFVSATRAKKRLVVTGRWVAFKKTDAYNPRLKENVCNRYLLNAYEAIDGAISREEAVEIHKIQYDLKKSARDEEKAAEKATDLKIAKRKVKFNGRKTRQRHVPQGHGHSFKRLKNRHR